MIFLYITTLILLTGSFIANVNKTIKALNVALKKLLKILPAFLSMLVFVSLILSYIPDNLIIKFIGIDNKLIATILASIIGSITIMPGFVAFPLCNILLTKGITYMVASSFSATLMMVGIFTYPIEKTYFGHKISIIRNILCFVIALIIAITTGMFYGEIF
jgi:uncharacterized membrane protein YraQ (UPF0718 family)